MGLTTSACRPSPSMVRKMTMARPGCPPLWHTVISDVYSTTFPFSPAIEMAPCNIALTDCQADRGQLAYLSLDSTVTFTPVPESALPA